MKKTQQILATIISLIILTIFVGTSWGQVCSGSYQIDEFDSSGDIAALSGCEEITGNLNIMRFPLTTLSGLEALTVVRGHFTIETTML